MTTAKLLCIPQEGDPFEASGIDNRPTAYDTYNMLGIVNNNGEGISEYDDDMKEFNTPFKINEMYMYNSNWNSISKIIEKFYNTSPRLHTIRLYSRKNQHHFNYNKHTIGDTRPKGPICIWITDNEYSNVKPLSKKKCVYNVIWDYEDINEDNISYNVSAIKMSKNSNKFETTHWHNTSTPHPLSWTMANL